MSQRTGPTRIKLSDFKERKELEGAIDVETDDGQVFRIPPPEIWPDEVSALARVQDVPGMARAILGDEKFEAFIAAGGTATLLNAIYADVHGADAGK